MLIIWTTANTSVIKSVFGPIVGRQRIEHRIEDDFDSIPHLEAGDVLLACGTHALNKLKDHGIIPKAIKSINASRQTAYPLLGGKVFTSYDPSIVNKEYERLCEIQWDCTLSIRYHETKSTKAKIGVYRWVESFHELINEVEKRYDATGKAVPVSADLETKGLDEYNPAAWIIEAMFTIDEGKSDVMYFERHEAPVVPADISVPSSDYWEALWQQFHWLFTTPKITMRGANFKFDSRWIHRKWGIDVKNLGMDTVLVGSLLNENRSNSLKTHVKEYVPELGGYDDEIKNYDMGSMELVPKETIREYGGGDTDGTHRVGTIMRKELLKDKRLTEFYVKILHPSSKVFEKMERTGVVVDVPYYLGLEKELEVELERLDIEMKKHIPAKLKHKYMDNFSLGRPALLHDFLFTKDGLNLKATQFTAKKGEPSTGIDHLLTFVDDPVAKDFIELMKESNSASKTLGTYVKGFLAHLRVDGRFHPHYLLSRGSYAGDKKQKDAGTVTGRTSAKDPAVQTIPKHTKWTKKLRRALIPPPGKTILQIDFSQGELKITACLAEEPTMLKAYANGLDLHAITAAQLNGYAMDDFMLLPEDTRDELRSGGKAGNFGLIYGMQAPGFQDYAWNSYGVKMTSDESVEKRDAFFALYSRLLPWHEEVKNYAKRWGYVRSPLGRVRHLPLINSPDREARSQAERQSLNSPVQSCLSDMMQLAMVMIDREYGHDGVVEMFMMTHDSVAAYVPIEDATIWAKRLKTILDNLPLKEMFGWNHQIPFTTDAEICRDDTEDGVLSFAYLKKLKGL